MSARAIPLTPRLACRALPIVAAVLLTGCAATVHTATTAAYGAFSADTHGRTFGVRTNEVGLTPNSPALDDAQRSPAPAATGGGSQKEHTARRLGPVVGRVVGRAVGRVLGRVLGSHQ